MSSGRARRRPALIVMAPGIFDRSGQSAEVVEAVSAISEAYPDEDVFSFIRRLRGADDTEFYARILGAANDFKDGDGIVGVAAADDASRRRPMMLRGKTRAPCWKRHVWRISTRTRFTRTVCSASFLQDEISARESSRPSNRWPNSNNFCWPPIKARSRRSCRGCRVM